MASRECLRCGLISPASTQRCDCGWDFETARLERPYVRRSEMPPADGKGSFLVGFLIGVSTGCIGLAGVHVMKTGIETRRGAIVGFGVAVALGIVRAIIILHDA